MRLVVIVPQAAAFIGGFEPFGLFGIFHMAIAEKHVGTLLVSFSNPEGTGELQAVREGNVKQILGIRGRRCEEERPDERWAITQSDHLRRGGDTAFWRRYKTTGKAIRHEVATEAGIGRRRIPPGRTERIVSVVRPDLSVAGEVAEEFVCGAVHERAMENLIIGVGKQ